MGRIKCWLTIGLTCICWSAQNLRAADQVHPNIVFVLIDDMGWADLSCFGGKAAVTENIDQLAAEGLRFSNFYVNSPICSPSRVALTTGQYPHRWKITSYLDNRETNEKRGVAQWLDPAAPVLARHLQQKGYATGHFGKWHMGGQRDVADAPPISAYGFDRSLTNFEGLGAKLLPLTMEPGWDKPKKIWEKGEQLGGPVTWMLRSEITSGFVQAAVEFIDHSQKAGQPFYINVWPDDVHTPLFPPLDKWGDGKRGRYKGVLDAMDEQLGPLFSRIRDDDQLRNNTLILLCSDNGPENGAGSAAPLRGSKTWLYEGGVRSPLIAWGPGLLASDTAGKVNEESVLCALDLNRSLYAIAAVGQPDQQLDGEDLSTVILGQTQASRSAPIFWRRPPDRPGFGHGMDEPNPDLAVRRGKWKFYNDYTGQKPQLYDLSMDASEATNVAEQHEDIVRELSLAIQDWNALLPADAGDPRK